MKTLAELASEGHLVYSDGYRTKKDELAAEGYRIIRVADVGDDVVRLHSPDFVEEGRSRFIGTKAAQEGDILLTTKGTVGRVAVMPPTEERAVYSPQLCFFRVPAGSEVVPGYLKAWFKSPQFLHQAAYFMNNTDMAAYLSLRDLASISIDLPAVAEQRAIAEVLGALDDKIAANDNVRGLAADLLAARYRAAVAEDATTVTVNEAAALLNRGASPRYTDGEDGVVVLNQKCVRGGNVDLGPARRTERGAVRAGTFLQINDVLVNSTGVGTLGRVATWAWDEEATVDSHVTIVRPDPGRVVPEVFGLAMMQLQSEIEGLAEGSTGQTELARQQLGPLPVLVPRRDTQIRLGELARVLTDRSIAAQLESQKLAALRDALLPELMSGRLRVKDAESTVEEVL